MGTRKSEKLTKQGTGERICRVSILHAGLGGSPVLGLPNMSLGRELSPEHLQVTCSWPCP